MQAESSVVVSKLAIVVLVLARSPMLDMVVSWSLTYIQHNQHTPLHAFPLPLMFRSVTRTTRVTTDRGSEERTVRDTYHTSRRQCFVSNLAVVLLVLARLLPHPCCTWWPHGRTPIFNTIITLPCMPSTTTHVKCYENVSGDYRT